MADFNRKTMYQIGQYGPGDDMSTLICENYQMLLVVHRFGIPLGFGDKSIDEVCRENRVDTHTFLNVVNLLVGNHVELEDIELSVSLPEIVGYLRNSHSYFLDFRLPSIRKKLLEAFSGNDGLTMAIIRYYDEYSAEVHKHMMHEEEVVFPYVKKLLAGEHPADYDIDTFSRHHDNVESKLLELKNIIIKYCPTRSSNELNNMLFDLFSCSEDLASHNRIEDELLIPMVRRLEM